MAQEFEMPDDYESSGGYVDAAGTFHCVVTEVKEGQGPSGKAADCDTFAMHVLAGTDPNQVGRQHSEAMFAPKLTSKDQGKFQRQQLAMFYIALGLVDPSQAGKSVSLNVADAVDRQFIIKLSRDKYNSDRLGRDVFSLDGLNVFHVDDPRVAKIPKDADSIKLIDAKMRRKPEWFEALSRKGEKRQTVAAGAGAGSAVNLDDL